MAQERRVILSAIPNGGEASPRRLAISRPELPSYTRHIREFNLPAGVEEELDEHQRQAFSYLVRAARRWADIYALQESTDPRKPFWPQGITRREVREASDPEVRSPYTIVEYDQNGKLVARPMHDFYGKQIKELDIIRLLRKAADETGKGRNRDFKLQAYLRAKARSLETGDFKASERRWLEREDEPDLDIFFGFYDTYSDEFLSIKYAAEASVGVLDRQATDDSQWFKSALLGWWERETGRVAPRIKVRVDHTRIQAGQVAKYEFTGMSIPCQMDWREELGSKFIIYRPFFEDKFRHRRLPSLRNLIDKDKIDGITDGFARLAALRKIIAHEISHSLVPGENHQERLGQETTWVKELYCDLLALVGYRHVKGLSMRESEIAMAMFFSDGYLDYEDRRRRPEYHRSSTIITQYPIQHGSLSLLDGRFIWHETPAVFEDFSELLSETQDILIDGKSKDAQRLRERYFDPTIYRYLIFKGIYPQPEETSPDSTLVSSS